MKQDVSIPKKVTIDHIMNMEEAYRNLFGHGPMAQSDSEESESESDSDRDSDATSSETNQDEDMPLADDVSIQDLEMELKNLEKQRKKR